MKEEKEKDRGIFAVVLVNHGNKKRFSNKFWKYKDEEENDYKNDEKHTML
ncbi:hypothetical protein [Rickettsia rickettsii]